MDLGTFSINVREGVGRVKIASEFYLMDSQTQLDLLDDWINFLEELYNTEVEDRGALRRSIQNRKSGKALREIPPHLTGRYDDTNY